MASPSDSNWLGASGDDPTQHKGDSPWPKALVRSAISAGHGHDCGGNATMSVLHWPAAVLDRATRVVLLLEAR
jgi:hypothetical protein